MQQFLSEIDAVDIGVPKELVLIDDNSTDSSVAIIENFTFQSEHKLITARENEGKGAALRAGITAASGEVIGVQDADFEYDFLDIEKLVTPIIDGKYDVIYGSRFKKDSTQVHRTFHYLVNRFLTLLSNMFSGLYLSDMETCYKFFRSDVIKHINLESPRFGFEPEVTAKIARLNVRIAEFPISYFPRTYLEGKKINWKDGVAAIWHIIFFNVLSRKNRYRETMPEKYITGASPLI